MSIGEEILRLRFEGNTYNEIKDKLGCSKGTISYHLGEGQKEKTRKRTRHTRVERRKLVAELKNVPCADCRGEFGYWQMDFDHVSDNKVASVSELLVTGTWQQVLDEVAKCEVVCSNCHRTRTRNRGYDTWH